MKHNCIDKKRKELMGETGKIKWIRFDLSTIRNTDGTGEEMTGQRITYGYTHKKKDGTEITKEDKSYITHTYCPFCGKKYKD